MSKSKPFNNALVVYKQAPAPSKRVPKTAAAQHLRTLDHVYSVLQEFGVQFRSVPIDQLATISDVDLVVTVGGDGTVLAASHYVTAVPILGVKSLGRSVGYFCAATRQTVKDYLRKAIDRKRRPRQLNRLTASIDGHVIQEPILNECLFAHGCPAAITNYKLCVGRGCEWQRSSGVWVSTAAGSTAAIAGAGGKPMRLDSTDVQYIVREPFSPNGGYDYLGEVLAAKTTLRIESHVQGGTLSIDGAHLQYPVAEGSTVTIKQCKQPLNIFWK